MTDPIPRLNAALEGRYRIERELGEGGMATVYLADDVKHERQVALKVLKPGVAAAVGAERFLAEIRTTARLQHPHILPLHDSGEADGLLFYVMPHVKGQTLRDRLDAEGQLPVDDALRIGSEIAVALQAAHRNGVLHRDIKPANILLSDGHAVVSDFGIALSVDGDGPADRLTQAGSSLGTPVYMSPEQASGDESVDARSDVYALACVVYEMLTGEPPFTGPTFQSLLAKKVTLEPAPLRTLRSTIPEHVDEVIRKALQRLPTDRPQSAQAFADELASGLGVPNRERAEARPRNNLPLAVDSFVGREEEIEQIVEVFQSARLVTITGVGGTGKTRLALAAADRLLPEYAHGAWLVELAPVLQEESVPQVIADVLGIRQREGMTMTESLVLSLKHQPLLLILDNCEHLLDAVAENATAIVTACPHVRVIATSREGLAVPGERLLPLTSLAEAEGVELFADRARAVGTKRELDRETLARLCKRLDGIPLAIELAAARCRTMTPEQIESRLDDRFRLLRGSRRGRTERHQTLRNAVAWSYDLLEPLERTVFDRLSAFAGGFQLDAAVAVAGGEDMDPLDVEDAVAALVERSMVLAAPTEDGTRYRLLETLRQFGEDRLIESGDGGMIRDRHLAWVHDFVGQAGPGLHGPDDVYWSRALRREFDNLRTAFYRAIDNGDGAAVTHFLRELGMWPFWTFQLEIGDWCLDAMSIEPEPVLARSTAADLYVYCGRIDESVALPEWDRVAQDPETIDTFWEAHRQWGYRMYVGDPSFREWVTKTVEIGRRVGAAPARLTFFEGCFTTYHLMAGRVEDAQRVALQCFDRAAKIENTEVRAWSHFFMGRAFPETDLEVSLGHLEQAAELAGRLGYDLIRGLALSDAAPLAVQVRDTPATRARFVSLCRRFADNGEMLSFWGGVHQLVFLLLFWDREDEARALWSELGDRPGYTSEYLRDELTERFGAAGPSEIPDQDLIERIRQILDGLDIEVTE